MNRRIFTMILLACCFGCSNDDNNFEAEQNMEPKDFPERIDGSLEHQGNQREFILHIPQGYDGTEETPLVMVLHGGSGNAESVQGFTQMNPVSDQNGFLVVYPQGFGPASPGYSWADGRATSATEMEVDDVGFIEKLVSELRSEYNVDSKKIYVCGFSNGGFMTQKLACELPDTFAGVGTLAATIGLDVLQNCSNAQSIPTIFMLGDADAFVPYDGGTVANNPTPVEGIETLVDYWVENNACATNEPALKLPNTDTTDNSTVTLFKYTDCDCNADVSFYRINGGEHTWSGVENVSYEEVAGETNEDINASSVLWSFFSQYELCLE
ncbi:prolyl oligopeptidase family serine peptidase [Muricauda sp. JGD-17]|uniref:Prolyl oligopeptidase family serine peptidase n=1 Tax=Flagellimonas ochracea TaxID=2696472 RepID=A0A964TED4_9FLAO|nr:PHB depolymerase family esterase [Allomuricauda ochracea]NAY93405.1 prolyl oligopeptidase family serine peptidase [Allomuricauda ochracea]